MKCYESCSNYAYDPSIYKHPWCLGNNRDIIEGQECFLKKRKQIMKRSKRKIFEATFKIRFAIHYNGTEKLIEDLINHHYSGISIGKATSELKLVTDKRKLPKPPFPCCKCEFCKGRECWYGNEYYGTEFDGDYEICFTLSDEKEREKILKKYFDDFEKFIGE